MGTQNQAEQTLLTVRTHPKVLFWPAVLQIILIAAHVLLIRYFPEDTGLPLVDEWGQLIVHGIIVILELSYTILPLLRWWNSTFTVTDRRVEKRWGILYKNSREIPFNRIVSIAAERGILDRIFGCGTLVFHDAASGSFTPTESVLTSQNGAAVTSGIRFHDVPHVERVRQIVDSARYEQAA